MKQSSREFLVYLLFQFSVFDFCSAQVVVQVELQDVLVSLVAPPVELRAAQEDELRAAQEDELLSFRPQGELQVV